MSDDNKNNNKVIIDYTPRPQFIPFHARSKRFALLVCHRRAGKTVACINDLVAKALNFKKFKNGSFAYVAPYYGQAKSVAWQYLVDATRDLPGTVVKVSELSVTLYNGSKIRLFGADNPESLRGLYFDGLILDEVGDMRESIWTVVRPALADRTGWIVFIGTPKGKNFFYEMREMARRDPDTWLYVDLKASESGLLSPEELEDSRKTMSEEQFRQEFENDFESSNVGAYYGKELRELEDSGHFIDLAPDPRLKTHVSFDLGFSDSTAMWFYQISGKEIHVVDYHEEAGQNLEHYHDILASKPYNYGTIWLPHDARARNFQTGVSTIEQMLSFGWDCQIVPSLKLQDGIQAVRKLLPNCWFDEKSTYKGVQCLKAYQKEWNAERKVFNDKPKHDWSSHGADSFRYMILSIARESKSEAPDTIRRAPPMVEQMTLEGLWDTARKPIISTRI